MSRQPAQVVDDGLTITGRPSSRACPFPAWWIRESDLGVTVTRCTVLEVFPVTMTARIRVGQGAGVFTWASFAQLASSEARAFARIREMMTKKPLVQTPAND